MSGVRLLDHWSPPDGAGDPVAVLATTFTFEADFFAQDCLSRFLSLSATSDEGDQISSVAAVLEEEDRLNEAQVSVLIDRSSPAEKRNLRWDVLPVSAPGGLLHAKVAVLLWERAARILIGSANLTSAGYRRQVETAMAFDLRPDSGIPSSLLTDLTDELSALVELVPGPRTGAKARAQATLDMLETRIQSLDLPTRQPRDLHLAIAASRPGRSPLDRLDDVWRGPRPLHASLLSPFWDGDSPAPALNAVRKLLTGRPAAQRTLTAIVAVDPYSGAITAPRSLGDEADLDVVAFDPPDTELRSLHAKVLLVESDDWTAAMIGSSNATSAGYGLDRRHGHHELNLWIGCPASSRTAKQLRSLLREGEYLSLEDEQWEPLPDDEEPTTPRLPDGFVWSTVHAGTEPTVEMHINEASIPSEWSVELPTGRRLLQADGWRSSGSPATLRLPLGQDPLPPYLVVRWSDDEGGCQATWPVNVEDRSALPPPAELADLPVEILLAALASSRPLPVALEHELRSAERTDGSSDAELDPLKRFDSSALLLQRTRHLSLALWRLEQRLARPVSSIEVVRWRLHGAVGPVAIAEGLVKAAKDNRTLPGEPHFLLAELALTVAAVNWVAVGATLDRRLVRCEVTEVLQAINNLRQLLPDVGDEGLSRYVDDAFSEVLV